MLTIRQLEILSAVLERGTLSAAALQLGLTQPAVSTQMKVLAAELGVTLFRSRGRRVEPTTAARKLGDHAAQILRLVRDAETTARSDHESAAVVRVAASTTPGVDLIPPLLTEYRRRVPTTSVRLEVVNSGQVESRIVAGTADLGVVGGQRTLASLHAEPWCEDELVLILSPGHPLAARRRARARDLAREILLVREAGSATRATVEAAFLRAGVKAPESDVMGDSAAIKNAVFHGLGVGIVSRFAVLEEKRAGRLAVLRISDLDLKRPLLLLSAIDRTISPAAQDLLDFLRRRAPRSPRRRSAP